MIKLLQKKDWRLKAIPIFATLVFFTGGIYYLLSAYNNKQIYPKTQNFVSSWKEYKNSDYGFSIKCPANYSVDEADDGIWFDKQIVIIVSDNPICNSKGDCPFFHQKFEEIAVGGIIQTKSIGYIGSMFGNPQRYQKVELVHNDKYYEIILYALKFDDESPFDDTRIKEISAEKIILFNQMLSTFEFIN